MKRGTTLFLQIAVFIIGVGVLALGLWLPWLSEEAAFHNPEYAYLRLPVLFGIYISAIPFYSVLFQALKLLHFIENENAFSHLSVISLRHIKNFAGLLCMFYAIGIVSLYFLNALHPGIAILGFAIFFASLVISVFAALLEELLRSALEIKAENDLTV